MNFDAFIGSHGAQRFLADCYGQRAWHRPAAASPMRLSFGWQRLNDLLSIAPHWTAGNLKLILNSQPIGPDFYLDEVQTFDGPVRRADPAKVDLFLGIGASLVANAVEDIAPEIRAVTDLLSQQFTALASANVYCSFDGVQAFATHYDTHEVFALQCEGEKRWRIYRNRAANPAKFTGTQAEIDAARGPVAQEVVMRPGDLLYIPRGMYHDALADRGGSLHVTFSVAPRTGMLLARLLQRAIDADPAFRAYLPAPQEQGGRALTDKLAELADRVAATIRSPAFALAVIDEQRRQALPAHRVNLPKRVTMESYARTDRRAELRRSDEGTALIVNGRSQLLGAAGSAAEWALARPAFSDRELAARFPQVPANDRAQLLQLLLREGLVQRYTPSL